ncbi:MAG: DUF2189 domain-containing protein [Hyphomicrobiaceae bacterium]
MSVLDSVMSMLGDTDGKVAPHILVRRVPFDQPWEWLAAGWRDLWTYPGVSLTYGLVFAAGAVLMAIGTTQAGAQSIILALFGGFLLVGPLVAVGLYEVSRRIEAGEPVTLAAALKKSFQPEGQLGFMGVVLFLIFMVWMQVAFLLFMLFTGGSALPPPSQFVQMLFFTDHGLGLLIFGTLAGALLAFFTFSVSVVSVPLLMVRDVDVATAISTSFHAVRRNPRPMLLWAALIAGFVMMGIATMCTGLVVVFPLIGHATWHAYKDLVEFTDGSATTT